MLRVFKFGGASVKDANSFHQAAGIIENYKDDDIVLVVSAIGKTTNALESIFRKAFYHVNEFQKDWNNLKTAHVKLLEALFDAGHPVFQEINELFDDILKVCTTITDDNFDRVYDSIVSYGELLSTRIIHHFLEIKSLSNTWLDVRKLIITDSNYRSANVDWGYTESKILNSPILKKSGSGENIFVTQGFIAGNLQGDTLTLGREGSDFSAAIFAAVLEADEIVIWKDVPGILNADPHLIHEAQKLDMISYEEAIEMAFYGARVIHPKTIQPLKKKAIPLHVKCFNDPDTEGTVICDNRSNDGYMPMIIFKEDQVLVTLKPKQLDLITDKCYNEIQLVFTRFGLKPNLLQNSAISLSACINNEPERFKMLKTALGKQYIFRYNENLRLVTIRHYNDDIIRDLVSGMEILLEQKSRATFQAIVKTPV